MLKYIVKRILLMPITLLLVCLIIFSLINLSRVDPAIQLLGNSYTQEAWEELHERLGLDKPIIVQYFNYVKNALTGDLGTSYYSKTSVTSEIAYRAPISLKLSLIVAALTMIFGSLFGILCATHQYSVFDSIANVAAKVFGAIPNFWFCMMLMLLFSVKLNWLPCYGISTWKHWILPVVNMTLPAIGNYMRYARSSMLDCIRQDYIRTARAKGNRERVVVWKHALKNALLPLITKTGMHIASLIGGAIVIENVYSIPGIGTMIITAIKQKDTPMVVGGTLFLAVFFLIVTLLIDLSYAAIDPRVKSTFVTESSRRRKKKPAAAVEGA